ncbi:MAG: hypothetical protein RR620_13270 [Clostridium sp.]
MRKLVFSDVFQAARLIKKVNLKDKIKNIYFDSQSMKSTNDEDVAKVGFDVFYTIFEECVEKEVENLVYDLLSRPFECTSEEVKMMELNTLLDNITLLAKENDLIGFFKQVVKLKL